MSDETYTPASDGLVGGAPLVIEDLDLSGLGLYKDEQKANLGGEENDWFDSGYTSLGDRLWARKSDEGTKRITFKDTEIKLHKDLVKGESNG